MNDESSAHTWRKSDLVLFAWTFGLIAFILGVYGLNHLRQGQMVEAAATAFAMVFPLVIALGFRRMLRKRAWEWPGHHRPQGMIEFDKKTWEQSILNPKHPFNQERIRNPPEIG